MPISLRPGARLVAVTALALSLCTTLMSGCATSSYPAMDTELAVSAATRARLLLERSMYRDALALLSSSSNPGPEELLLTAMAHEELGEYDRAGELLQSIPAPGEDSIIGICPAELCYLKARLLFREGAYQAVLALPEEMKDEGDEDLCKGHASVLANILEIRALTALSRFDEARLAVESIQALDLDDDPQRALLDEAHGELRLAMGESAAALDLYNHGLALWRKAFPVHFPIHPQTARFLSGMAQCRYMMDDLSGARDLLMAAHAIFTSRLGKTHPDSVMALNDLGAVGLAMGDLQAGRLAFHQALDLARQNLDPLHPDLAVAMNNLAVACKRMGDYARAESLYREALAIRTQALGPEHPDSIQTLANLALVLARKGSPGQALPLLEQALELHRKILGPDHPTLATDMVNLALLHKRTGNLPKALDLLQRALDLRIRLLGPDHAAVGRTYENLALVLERMEAESDPLPMKPEEAHERAWTILSRSLGPDHPHVRTLTSNRAVRLMRSGDAPGAAQTFSTLLEQELAAYGPVHPLVAADRINLGNALLEQDDAPRAGEQFRQALVAAESMGDAELLWRARDGVSRCLGEMGRTGPAILMAKLAVETLLLEHESLVRDASEPLPRFLDSRSEPFRRLAALLLAQDRLAEAEQTLRLLKADESAPLAGTPERSMILETAQSFTGEEQQARDRYRELQSGLAGMGQRVEELLAFKRNGTMEEEQQEELDRLRRELAQANQAFTSFLDGIVRDGGLESPARAMDIGARQLDAIPALRGRLRDMREAGDLDGSTAIIHYLSTGDELHILLTTERVTVVRSLPVPRALLANSVLAFRRQVADPDNDPIPLAQQLYELLMAPLEEDLQQIGARTLLLSLDGPLRYLPFAALHTGHGWLVEDYALSLFNPLFAPGTGHAEQSAEVAALGTSASFERFPALPAVPLELEAIVRRADDDPDGVAPGIIRLDHDFTLPSLQDALDMAYPVLHLASHFVFSPADVRDSYLLLGDGQTLSLAAIRDQGMDFGSLDLLTLSACDTAMSGMAGPEADGREIDGFSGLAAKQGARAVLATLWPVADGSTGLFMQRFYASRFQESLALSQALRATQLAFIQDPGRLSRAAQAAARSFRIVPDEDIQDPDGTGRDTMGPDLGHPYFWAPFVLMSSGN